MILALLLMLSQALASRLVQAEPPPSNPEQPIPPVEAPKKAPVVATQKKGEPGETDTKLIPLPVYATLPNEGSTFGFMPVFLVVEKENQRTRSIFAPSASWNRIIKVTGTFRWFYYPTEEKSITLTASGSAYVNAGTLFIYNNRPKDADRMTDDLVFRLQRSVFFRFYGIGANSNASDESSHTRARANLSYRKGYNVSRRFNAGAQVEFSRDVMQKRGAPGLPLTQDVFPNAPGQNGASILYEGLSLRYDTRENAEYSDRGWATTLSAGTVQGLQNSDSFQRYEWENIGLFPEDTWIQGAGRTYWSYVTSANVPFYYQSMLGGSYRLRGFNDDRFTDQGAWEVEFEQRIRLFQTRIYGVTTDWRMDPFIAVGQVYHGASDFFEHPRVAGGVGFRAFVRPNVLGRVDIGLDGEGAKFYVELGYPY